MSEQEIIISFISGTNMARDSSKLEHVHRGYAIGKIYNTDRQCFLNRECTFGLSDRGRGGSRLPACMFRRSSSLKLCG